MDNVLSQEILINFVAIGGLVTRQLDLRYLFSGRVQRQQKGGSGWL